MAVNDEQCPHILRTDIGISVALRIPRTEYMSKEEVLEEG